MTLPSCAAAIAAHLRDVVSALEVERQPPRQSRQQTSRSAATVFTRLSLPQKVNHVASSVVSNWQYNTASSEGSHDPDMMTEVVPRFEPFERCCMAILFCGRPKEDDAPPNESTVIAEKCTIFS